MTDYFYGATEQEAIAKGIENAYVEFNGMNCEDWDDNAYCAGWDGESRRCQCGNRRVGWETEEQEPGRWAAYGEAW